MEYKSIDANATDDNEVINLAHCGDCDYTGNKGRWKGMKSIGAASSKIDAVVELRSDDTWELNDIIGEDNDKNVNIWGDCQCPICGSLNFY